jgi:diadenosine tetraphosphate (Ap4A) HIT family hydrolase
VLSRLVSTAQQHSNPTVLFDQQHVFAVLDAWPVSRGHTLVVLKEPAATLLHPISDAGMLACSKAVQDCARAVQAATECAGGGRAARAADGACSAQLPSCCHWMQLL